MNMAGNFIAAMTLIMCAASMADEPATAEPVIPQGYPTSRYEAVWGRNPFELESPPPAIASAEPDSFAKSLSISSVMRIGSKVTVHLFDRSTKSYYRISEEPNPDGMRLLSLVESPDPRNVTAEIAKGAESATVRYDGARIFAAASPSANRPPASEKAAGEAPQLKDKGANPQAQTPEDRRLGRTLPLATTPEERQSTGGNDPSGQEASEVKAAMPDLRRKIILPKKPSTPAS